MPKQIGLPVGFWGVEDPRASNAGTINCFPEVAAAATTQSPADAKQSTPPVYLRRAPGITQFAGTGSTTVSVRGMWEMSGVLYAVIGANLYSVNNLGTLNLLATGIGSSGFVRMTDNKYCLVILIPGTTICYTYCPAAATPFQTLTASTFLTYGAIDCWFDDTYIVFLALNGLQFFNDDGQAVSGTGQITFTTAAVFPRQLATDSFIGMAVDHREVLMFGERTSEGFLNVGNPTGSPFSSAPQSYMPIGMHPLAAYTAVLQDQTVFWIANDLTVRRRNGSTPVKVSNQAVDAFLSSANLTGCYGFAYSIAGHLMVAFTLPQSAITIVYDCTTQLWHKMSSVVSNIGYWRPQSCYNWNGKQLIGDSQSGNIGYLDTTSYAEFGQPMSASWQTQSVYDSHHRISHRRLEAVVTAGGSTSISSGANLTCYKSDDGGRTYMALPMANLGAQGNYTARAQWSNLGSAYDRAYKFLIADPTQLFVVDIVAELEGGRY
jgi:hypothetical protein